MGGMSGVKTGDGHRVCWQCAAAFRNDEINDAVE